MSIKKIIEYHEYHLKSLEVKKICKIKKNKIFILKMIDCFLETDYYIHATQLTKGSLIMKIFSILSLIVCMTTSFLSIEAHEENPYQSLKQAAISGTTGTPWNSARQIYLVEKAQQYRSELIDQAKRLSYPISEEDLYTLLEENENAIIPFFAYSSMIDKNAAAVKAISQEGANTHTPAIAFGIQRTFDRQLPESTVKGGFGELLRSNDLAILNAFEKEDAVINGVVFHLPVKDLLVLTKREVGYDLIPVLVMNWEDAAYEKGESSIFLAYTFLSPEVTIDVTEYTSNHVNPVPGYVHYLQKGLDAQGEDFKAMWWATTFLADKKTPIKELPYHNIDLKARR